MTFIPEKNERGIYIEPGECIFIPTGIVFDIPPGYKVVLYPRSGLSGKNHIKLANCTGITDEDFVLETKILLFNDSEKRQTIVHGERIAQAEIQPVIQVEFRSLSEQPLPKTDRKGGFGHSGSL